MSVAVYTIARNEAMLMPYFMRHYGSFAAKIVVYDDESDDGTPEIVTAGGGEVRPTSWHGLDDKAMVELANSEYRNAGTDWVIWVDADEFIYARDLPQALKQLTSQGVMLPMVTGYCMTADGLPTSSGQIYDEIKTGFRAERYDKACVVNPSLPIAWAAGRHEFMLGAQAIRSVDGYEPLMLLHYRWFGRAYCDERSAKNWDRLSVRNRVNNLGIETNPAYVGPYTPAWYEDQASRAGVCI
jgi:hypothetical protein